MIRKERLPETNSRNFEDQPRCGQSLYIYMCMYGWEENGRNVTNRREKREETRKGGESSWHGIIFKPRSATPTVDKLA